MTCTTHWGGFPPQWVGNSFRNLEVVVSNRVGLRPLQIWGLTLRFQPALEIPGGAEHIGSVGEGEACKPYDAGTTRDFLI